VPGGSGRSYVFADESGRRLSRSGRVRSTLARLAREAGLDKLGPHMFRHGHATELARAGWAPATAAARLGHADGGVLFLRTYQHVTEADQAAALETLSRARKARSVRARRADDEQRPRR
jgi:integrase